MKQIADKQRWDVKFEERDWVLVKLRPCRQSPAIGSLYSKLAKRFYRAFQITKKIGPIAYKLDLPATSQIHPVFHYSLLKPYLPPTVSTEVPIDLPASAKDNQPVITPLTILDTKWQTSNNGRQLLVLVQWTRLLPKDTFWEQWEILKVEYNLENKVVLEAHRDVMTRSIDQQN